VDAYWTAEQLAFASLQLRVNWMFRHNWRRDNRWLRCVPVGFGFIQLGWQCFLKPPLTDGKLKPTLPAGLAEADQCFFAWMARSA